MAQLKFVDVAWSWSAPFEGGLPSGHAPSACVTSPLIKPHLSGTFASQLRSTMLTGCPEVVCQIFYEWLSETNF